MNNIAWDGIQNMEVVVFDKRDLLENTNKPADNTVDNKYREDCLCDS